MEGLCQEGAQQDEESTALAAAETRSGVVRALQRDQQAAYEDFPVTPKGTCQWWPAPATVTSPLVGSGCGNLLLLCWRCIEIVGKFEKTALAQSCGRPIRAKGTCRRHLARAKGLNAWMTLTCVSNTASREQSVFGNSRGL